MPHIIVEYAEKTVGDAQIDAVLQAIHRSVLDSGLFEESHIKTRAYPFHRFTNGGGSAPYLHVQARIKSGRDIDKKKRLGKGILEELSALNIPVAVITVEIVDMDRDSYCKCVQNGKN